MHFLNKILMIYSLPGKLLAEFWYLWSKKGQLWGSSRRRNHGFVHFVYATGIYVFLFFVLTLLVGLKSGFPSSSAGSSRGNSSDMVEQRLDAGSEDSAQEGFLSQRDNEAGEEYSEGLAQVAEPVTEETVLQLEEPEQKPELSRSQISAAMAEAFQAGGSVRVESNGVGGYAVASEANSDSGCRAVHFTYDGESRPRHEDSICP